MYGASYIVHQDYCAVHPVQCVYHVLSASQSLCSVYGAGCIVCYAFNVFYAMCIVCGALCIGLWFSWLVSGWIICGLGVGVCHAFCFSFC